MQEGSTRIGNPARQQGVLFGIIAGIDFALTSILSNIVGGGIASIINIILLLVGLFLYAVAGYRASAQTGRVSTGSLAGLFVGLIGGIIGLIVTLIIVLALTDTLRQRAQTIVNQAHINFHYTNAFIIQTGIVGAITGLVIAIGFGAGLGAIGGLIGRSRAPRPQQYQEAYYQGIPPASPPAPPPPPATPPPPPPADTY